jgi:transporter family-2 protein
VEISILALALLAGALLALQAAANVQLSSAVGGPLGASPLQLGIAAVLLAVGAAGAGTLTAIWKVVDVSAWHLTGGLASPLYITAGMLLFPRLGALTSVGLFIAGQMLASLTLDGFGLAGVRETGLTAGSLAGALAVIGGATVIVRVQSGRRDKPVRGRPAWVVLGLIAGAGLPVQAAVNAMLRTELDAPLTAAMVSFTVATTAAAVVLLALVVTGRSSLPRLRGVSTMPWWGWLGGFGAAVYVTVGLLAIPVIGAAATVAITVAGQQLASAAVDHYGLLRLARRPVAPARLIGVVGLLIGAALIQFN